MFELPEKLKSFTAYKPLVGDYKVRLDVNESFIEIEPEKITEAISAVKFNRYPDPYATGAVKAFSGLLNVNPALVTAGNGSDELIGLIVNALLQRDDKVLCLDNDFTMYKFYSTLIELDTFVLPKNSDLTIDVSLLIEKVNSENIKCVFFSNPCNPTSLGIFKTDVKKIIENTSALIVLDEAYMDFWDEAESLLDEAGNYDNLIILRTCSKSVALAGIRLGFAVSNEKITNALKKTKSPFNVNAVTQAIGEAILSDSDNYFNSIKFIKESTAQLYNGLKALNIFQKIYETRTNFVYVKTPQAKEVYNYLLGKSIAVRCFDGHLRICAGTEEENEMLFEELKKWK
ncbi:MAG: aminotransferase class I/II-fold pyridoxal phosphate-dependent enzyme [Oscillospiraceae bacterium]|nr:aminotransferase class I/II-fold pyridoxal phosphate-dependent enzyme [Oscillospiraceae bacterium]